MTATQRYSLAQSPLGDEVDEHRLHFPAVQADAHDVEIRVAGQPLNLLLPLLDARGELAEAPAATELASCPFPRRRSRSSRPTRRASWYANRTSTMIRNTSCTAFSSDSSAMTRGASANRKSEMTGTSDVRRRWAAIVAVKSPCAGRDPSFRRLLVQIEAVDHVRLADARPRGGELPKVSRRR